MAAAEQGFVRGLLGWYGRNKRDLPWRGTTNPYAVWVSEIMLQQTTVGAVIPYYQRWLKRFPDIESLARAPLSRVLKAWQGLGYYQRARNLRAAAKIVVERHGGRLPETEADLRALPGFGPYTTAAVASIAFGRRVPLVDANVRRVLMRIFGLEGPAGARNDPALLERLAPLVPVRRPGDFNQALMELGALICRPVNPACLRCPVRFDCLAFAAGRQEVIPAPVRHSFRKLTAVVGIIEQDGRILIQQRPAEGLLGGLWEFPGGKVRPGESLPAALARELEEEIGAKPKAVRPFMTVDHSYTRFLVTLHAFTCGLRTDPAPDRSRRWVRPADLRKYPVPSGSARIVEKIIEIRRSGPARRARPAGTGRSG
jgi:A/G-specific adenine glycosylase